MKVKFTIKGFDPKTIMEKYQLNPNGNARLFHSNNCFRRMHKYVPFDTGMLASTVTIKPDSVTYEQHYARKQYYTNKGDGKKGKLWDRKMVTNEKEILTRELENYVKMCKGRS